MRLSEIRLLRWSQVDFAAQVVAVGRSKTAAGTGRIILMNEVVVKCLAAWSALFPARQPSDFVFPSEKYGAGGDHFTACVYETDPSRPIGSWKEAWEKARADSKVCRFHDLRHHADFSIMPTPHVKGRKNFKQGF
jgi:integrase